MTAINVIRGADRIFLMTDGAAVDAEGVMQEIMQKVIIMPLLRAVVAFRGPVELAAAVNLQVTSTFPRSFDDLLDVLPGAVAAGMTTVEARGRCEIIVAGISFKRQCTESYFLFTEAWSIPDPAGGPRRHVEALELAEAPHMVAAPVPSPALMAEFGLSAELTAEQFNPYVHGVALMHAQRRTPHEDGRGLYIGGVINLNTITAAGVNSEILMTWPDRIGEKIAAAG